MAGGRPTDYDPSYCEVVLPLGRAGLSLTQMAAHIGISKQTFYNWRDSHPEFMDATLEALTYAQAHWEEIAYKGAKGELPVNGQVLTKSMAARFSADYMERKATELSGPDGRAIEVAHSTLSEADLDAKIKALQLAAGVS